MGIPADWFCARFVFLIFSACLSVAQNEEIEKANEKKRSKKIRLSWREYFNLAM